MGRSRNIRAMIADCRQCEQRQPSAAANLGSFGAKAKFGGAENLREKNLSAGAPYTFALCTGPTRGYPPPLRMLTISTPIVSTLTISMLIISTHLVSTLAKPPSERSLT